MTSTVQVDIHLSAVQMSPQPPLTANANQVIHNGRCWSRIDADKVARGIVKGICSISIILAIVGCVIAIGNSPSLGGNDQALTAIGANMALSAIGGMCGAMLISFVYQCWKINREIA